MAIEDILDAETLANIQKTVAAAATEQAKLNATYNEQAQVAQTQVTSLNDLGVALDQQLASIQEIQKKQAATAIQVAEETQDYNEAATTTYDQRVNSKAATENRDALIRMVQERQARVIELENQVQNNNFFQNIIARPQLTSARRDLNSAQRQLNLNTGSRIQATQSYMQALSANTQAVGQRHAKTVAQDAAQLKMAEGAVRVIQERGRFTAQELSAQSQLLGITEKQMNNVTKEMELLQKKNQLTQAAVTNLYQQEQVKAFRENQEVRERQATDKEATRELMKKEWETYVDTVHRGDSELKAINPMTLPDNDVRLRDFFIFNNAQARQDAPLTQVLAARATRDPNANSPANSAVLNMWNGIHGRLVNQAREDATKKAKEAGMNPVEAQQFVAEETAKVPPLHLKYPPTNADEEQQLAEADVLIAQMMQSMNESINETVQSGAISYPTFQALQANPSTNKLLTRHVPPELLELFTNGEGFKDFDFSIGGSAPQQSVDGIVDFVTQVANAVPDIQQRTVMVDNIANGLAGLYTTQRKILNVNGFPQLSKSVVNGVRPRILSSNNNLIDSQLQRINIENAGDWSLLLKRSIAESKARAQSPLDIASRIRSF